MNNEDNVEKIIFNEAEIMINEAVSLLNEQLSYVKIKVDNLDKNLTFTRKKLKEKQLENIRSQELIKTQEIEINNLQKQMINPESGGPINSNLKIIFDEFKLDVYNKIEELSSILINLEVGNEFLSNLTPQSPEIESIPNLSSQFDKLSNQIREISDSIEDDSVNIDYDEFSESEFDSDHLASIKNDFSTLINNLNKTQDELNSIKIDNEKLLQQLELEKGTSLSDDNVQGSYNELKELVYDLENQNSELTIRIQNLESDLIEREEDTDSKQEIFHELKNQITKYVKENMELKEKLEDSNESIIVSKLENQMKKNEQNNSLIIAQLRNERDELLQKEKNLEPIITTLKRDYEQESKKSDELVKNNDEINKENETLINNVQELQMKIDNLEKILSFTKKELADVSKSYHQELIIDKKQSKPLEEFEELEEEVSFYKDLIIEKDQQISSLNKKIESGSINIDKLSLENKDDYELLLKLSELEMEESTWQDEKKLLLDHLEKAKSSSKNESNQIHAEELQLKVKIIEALRTEIVELGDDIDDADDKIDELSIENAKLKELHEVNDGESQASTITSEEMQKKDDEIKSLKAKLEIIESKKGKPESDQLKNLVSSLLPKGNKFQKDGDLEGEIIDQSATDSMMNAIGDSNVFLSLVDKFLKPSIQVTYLVKQGNWDHESLAETAGLTIKELKEVLIKLAEENVIGFNDYKIWWIKE